MRIYAPSLSTHRKMSFYWLVTQWTSVSPYDWEQRITGGGRYFYDAAFLFRYWMASFPV